MNSVKLENFIEEGSEVDIPEDRAASAVAPDLVSGGEGG